VAIAVQATKLDSKCLWVEVLDTDGGRTKYRRGGQASPGSELDLAWDFFRPDEIALVPRADGTPHLRQEGAGLPMTAVMSFAGLPQSSPGAALGATGGWHPEDRFEYKQVEWGPNEQEYRRRHKDLKTVKEQYKDMNHPVVKDALRLVLEAWSNLSENEQLELSAQHVAPSHL
jgi:hypothetical protein